MKTVYIKTVLLLTLIATLGFLGCSDDKKKSDETPNSFSFSHQNKDGLIVASRARFEVTTKNEFQTAEEDKDNNATSEVMVATQVYTPLIYQKVFLKFCEQTSQIGKIKGVYYLDVLAEDCEVVAGAKDAGLIDVKDLVLKSVDDSNKLTSNKTSDLFKVLPLDLVANVQITELSINKFPMDILFDVSTMSVIGFKERAQQEVKTSSATVNATNKANVAHAVKFLKLKNTLKSENLIKDVLTPEELEKVRTIAETL